MQMEPNSFRKPLAGRVDDLRAILAHLPVGVSGSAVLQAFTTSWRPMVCSVQLHLHSWVIEARPVRAVLFDKTPDTNWPSP